MLHRYSEIFRGLLFATDLGWVALCWAGAYGIRFYSSWGAPLGKPEPGPYLIAGLLMLPVFAWLFRARGLYAPRRTDSLVREAGSVLGATTLAVVFLLAADAALRSYLSRGVIVLFWASTIVGITTTRVVVRSVLRRARRRGRNLHYVLVVGSGELAEQVIERIHAHPEAGLRVRGVLSQDPTRSGRRVQGVPVLGEYGQIKEVLERQPVDQVAIALRREEALSLEKILADLEDELVSVRYVPDLLSVMTLRSEVEELDGLPVINLREGPLLGWAGVQKRAFDVVLSALALLAALPVMILIAAAVRLSSGSPVFFTQERMGLDGDLFHMIKFRSLPPGAERESGPVWTKEGDGRATRIGALLRRTSLDELPQLWNVLKGDMSLVGPRPERPVFIEQFRREIPGYMLRHKVKAGLTGWAQIHGWRGNTSLHERVEHDIYYIQNWSLGLDLRILVSSLWRFVGRNAY